MPLWRFTLVSLCVIRQICSSCSPYTVLVLKALLFVAYTCCTFEDMGMLLICTCYFLVIQGSKHHGAEQCRIICSLNVHGCSTAASFGQVHCMSPQWRACPAATWAHPRTCLPLHKRMNSSSCSTSLPGVHWTQQQAVRHHISSPLISWCDPLRISEATNWLCVYRLFKIFGSPNPNCRATLPPHAELGLYPARVVSCQTASTLYFPDEGGRWQQCYAAEHCLE